MKKSLLAFIVLLFALRAWCDDTRAIAVLLDISKSIPSKDFEKGKEFVGQLVNQAPASESFSLYAFGNELRKVSPDELQMVQASDSYTMLYDAVYDAAAQLAQDKADRKAILIISDGHDTKSVTILEDTVSFANSNGIAIYGIGAGKVNRKSLERIAKLTGGKYFELNQADLAAGIQTAVGEQAKVPASRLAEVTPSQPVQQRPAPAPQAAQPAQERGFSPYWILAIVIGALVVLLLLFVILRSVREEPRVCPTCGKRLEPYQTVCPTCSATKTEVAKKPQPIPSDGTQEIRISMEEADAAPFPMELLEKKPVTEEMLSRTFVLMETPMLVVQKGKNLGQSYSLNRAFPISIGRSRVNEILIDDVTVSGQHCRIIPENGKHVLYDLGSTNGTFVNEKKVQRAVLRQGDVVKVGETLFLYKIEQHRT